jgi:hypothetical protein
MNFLETKKIGNIERLDEARLLLNDCPSIDDVAGIINHYKRNRFGTTLSAVYCYDCIMDSMGDVTALKYIKTLKDAMERIDPHWDAIVAAGAKTLPGGYHQTASKVLAILNRLRKEKGLAAEDMYCVKRAKKEVKEEACLLVEETSDSLISTEVAGHSYTDKELAKLARQMTSKRWAVAIFVGDKMVHLTKWHTSAKTAKADALMFVVDNNFLADEYTAWLNNQAEYNEEIELK